MTPWKLPLIVAVIAVPIVAAFYVSPGLGLAVGALAVVAIVAVAARQRPREALGTPAAGHERLLVVVSRPVEDPVAIEAIAAAAHGAEGGAPARVRVLAPARIGFLDRWASDLERAQQEAQRRLVITIAALAKAGVEAEARVGDEDLVQAVEDQLQSFVASEVILVTGPPAADPDGERAAAELEQRLRTGFRRLALSGPTAR